MLDGIAGAVIGAVVGGLVSFGIALLVLKRTRADNEDLAREQASLEAARHLAIALHRLLQADDTLRSVPDVEAIARLQMARQEYDVAVLSYAPAIRRIDLRKDIEGASALTQNFCHVVFESRKVRGEWDDDESERTWAAVQRADWIYCLNQALTAYRRGDDVTLRPRPGWIRKGHALYWRIPPGVHVEGSGTPHDGWESVDLDGERVWKKSGESVAT